MGLPGLRSPRMPLADFDFLEPVHPRDLARLEQLVPVAEWRAGDPPPAALVRPGHLVLVRDGLVAIVGATPTAHPIMIALLDAGSVWSALGSTPPPEAVALGDAAVSAIPEGVLAKLVARYPGVGLGIAAALSDRAAMLREVVMVVGERRVEDRLRARLVQLARRTGVATPDGVRLDLGLTHAQWALLVGSSREAVTAAFGRLREERAATVEDRVVTLSWQTMGAHDPGRDAQEAGGARVVRLERQAAAAAPVGRRARA